jgi:hypothetical protein
MREREKRFALISGTSSITEILLTFNMIRQRKNTSSVFPNTSKCCEVEMRISLPSGIVA